MQHWANVASNIFHLEWLKDSAFVVVVVSLKCDLRKIENCLMLLDIQLCNEFMHDHSSRRNQDVSNGVLSSLGVKKRD